MGCCAPNAEDPIVDTGKDLPAPSLMGVTDVYQRFELSLPFSRILIKSFLEKVDEAEKQCGEGYVTIEALKAELSSPAWLPLSEPDSSLYKFLTSGVFKNEAKGHTPEQIDTDYLRIFGLLHCGGQPKDKAVALYAVLQEGGVDSHEFISAQDKDLNPVFDKICAMCCWEMFTSGAQIGGIESIYSDDDSNGLKEQVEALREDVFLEEVFGVQSRLDNAEWLDAVSKKANWVFNPVQLRKKLFELASLEDKHHTASPLGN